MVIQDQDTLEYLEKLQRDNNLLEVENLFEKCEDRGVYSGPIRSALMVSAARIKHLNKLDEISADIAVINLEDGVSLQEKPMALRMAALMLSRLSTANSLLTVRVNALDEGGEEEIVYLNRFKPHAFRIPKVESVDDVKRALSLIDQDIDIHLSIETASAFQNSGALRVDKRITVFYLGILDLLNDLGLSHDLISLNNPVIDYILSRFLIDVKSAGGYPVSFVFQDYKDLATLSRWCEKEKSMGFSARGAVAPGQVAIINSIFDDNSKDIEKARYIVNAFESMKKEGVTGFPDSRYGFIDEPIYKNALRILGS